MVMARLTAKKTRTVGPRGRMAEALTGQRFPLHLTIVSQSPTPLLFNK